MPPNSMLLLRFSCFSQFDVPWIVVNFWLFSRVLKKFIFDYFFFISILTAFMKEWFFFYILILSFLKKPVCFCHLFLIWYLTLLIYRSFPFNFLIDSGYKSLSSQVALVVKNLPANAGCKRCGFNPWVKSINLWSSICPVDIFSELVSCLFDLWI